MKNALRDLVSFVQFKKREKHPWRTVTFKNTKSNTPPWEFFKFFKLHKWYQIEQCTAYSVSSTSCLLQTAVVRCLEVFLGEFSTNSFWSKETCPILRVRYSTCALLGGPWHIWTDVDMQVEKYIQRKNHWKRYLNPLRPGVAFLYPLKTSEKFQVLWCFQGV